MKKLVIEIVALMLLVNLVFSSSVLAFSPNISGKSTSYPYPNICLDRDDFDTYEEYEQYVKVTGDISAQYPANYIPHGTQFNTQGYYANNGATADMRYVFYTDLKHTTAVQKTYIDSSYIYVLQREGKDMYLSRCRLNGSRAQYIDEMKLADFGHSQTLELFEYGSTSYFWIACKASDTTDKYWSTQVGRLEYKPGTTVNYTDIKRLSSLAKANKTGTAYGTIKRVDAALSSDQSILLVWSKNTENKMQFTFYDAAKVNAALSNSSSKYVSCDSVAIKNACISSFSMYNTFLIDGSCQGLEVSNAKSIYMASGARDEKKWIFKLDSTGNVTGKVYMENPILLPGANTEIEGLQLKYDDVYFGMCNHNNANKTEQYIFSVPKNIF